MQIGELALEIVKPENLEERLVASTGCLAAEVREHLTRGCIAGHVAAALLPFVKDPPAMITLAQAIVAAGVHDIRVEVLKLYDAVLGIEPEPMPEHLRGLVDANGDHVAPAPVKEPKRGKTKA